MFMHGPVWFSLTNEVDTLLLGLDPSQKIGSQTYHQISLEKHVATFRIHPPAFSFVCAMTLSLFLVLSIVHFYFQMCQSFQMAVACCAFLQFCAFAHSVSTARNAFPLGLPAELLLSLHIKTEQVEMSHPCSHGDTTVPHPIIVVAFITFSYNYLCRCLSSFSKL